MVTLKLVGPFKSKIRETLLPSIVSWLAPRPVMVIELVITNSVPFNVIVAGPASVRLDANVMVS